MVTERIKQILKNMSKALPEIRRQVKVYEKSLPISETDLILKNDNIYHLDINKDNVATTIILVGDQYRVPMVSKYFDTITHKSQHREFVVHTGTFKGKELSVISTGIGADNIDIVVNELDAIFNIDLKTRKIKKDLVKLNLIRLGTCGTISADIPVDSIIMSEYGLGVDNLLSFYEGGEKFYEIALSIENYSEVNRNLYIVEASENLKSLFKDFHKGITATFPGFYAPQGRNLRINNTTTTLIDDLAKLKLGSSKVVNFEMETSALYGLAKLAGHNALTLCTVVANRATKTFTKDSESSVDNMIKIFLNKITE